MRVRFSFCGVMLAMGLLMGCQTAAGADAPTTQPLSATSSLDQILDALDARGQSLKDFSAIVKMTDTDMRAGDQTVNDGKILLQKIGQDDARVKIVFDQKEQDDKIFEQHHDYILDNGKLIERDYDSKPPKQITRQIVRPGEKMNLLKLGQGPFPLPIGQKKEDVKAQFDVKKIDPAKDDPAGTIHLQLTPRAGSSFARQFTTIDLWIDTATAMPRRIETVDLNKTTKKTTDLINVKINPGLKPEDFVEPELPPGWETIDEPFGD